MKSISPGVRYMILAIFFFAIMNLCVKFISHIPAAEIVLFRSIISLAISVVMLKHQGVSLWGHNRSVLFLRGLAGTIALILYFITLQRIPLAGAVTIHYLAPVFTSVLGIYLVKEKVKAWQFAFFALAFGGILVIQGVDTRITLFDASLGIGGALFTGLAYNMIRKLKTSEHPLVIIFYFPLVSIPITGLLSLFDWAMPKGWDWIFLLFVGILTQLGQFYMTKSYQSEELSKVSVISYMGIVFALSFGFIFFDEHYGISAYLGMGLVLLGVLLNLWYKARLDGQTTS